MWADTPRIEGKSDPRVGMSVQQLPRCRSSAPGGTRPAVEIRTMVSDLTDASNLPNDIPNMKTHTMSFYMKILGAWIKMGFKNPKITVAGKIDV